MPTLVQEFTDVFRTEHRGVRDLLLDLVEAFRLRDTERVRELVRAVDAATGPHFRYEEESMYPQLVAVFGAEYVAKLLTDHDGAIRNVRRLYGLAEHDRLTPRLAEHGIALTRQILPHVSDCDGLSIMVETLPDDTVEAILATRRDARAAGLTLLTWAATARDRDV
ncbi:hemerythrin domain-containing protein [Actinomadura bangladeshensis]|uniref:Hemerythrin domain-containing protein n=1 Tax=Actinomadura bangladeshensis TaxID=453573 RepID=A0A4R4P9V7_9ACTN|nr:hemerythrin domain-containing protein [Actinomadura bangladeshensis]TDC17763.1 hemerythrin domain-containing protein [Actinomadura bangladeshensis]